MPIYNYHIYKDHIELVCPGSVRTCTGEEMNNILSWIKDAKRWLPKDSSFKDHVCNYLECMWEEVYGY